MDDHDHSWERMETMINRQTNVRRIMAQRKRNRHVLLLAIALLAGAAILLAWKGADAAAGATRSCDLTVPQMRVQLDGSGTRTGHVSGSCTFKWHSVNRIELEDAYTPGTFIPMRWHVLGIHAHPGGKAGELVRQSIDRDAYHGCGEWRESVAVYDRSGARVLTVNGPEHDFCS